MHIDKHTTQISLTRWKGQSVIYTRNAMRQFSIAAARNRHGRHCRSSAQSIGHHEPVVRWLRLPGHLPCRRGRLLQEIRTTSASTQNFRRLRRSTFRLLYAVRIAAGYVDSSPLTDVTWSVTAVKKIYGGLLFVSVI